MCPCGLDTHGHMHAEQDTKVLAILGQIFQVAFSGVLGSSIKQQQKSIRAVGVILLVS